MAPRERKSKEAYARPDHHDPTARFAGAAPARSALTLRIILACFGLVICAGAAIVLGIAGAQTAWVAGAAVLAAIALVDLIVVARRKTRGEPG